MAAKKEVPEVKPERKFIKGDNIRVEAVCRVLESEDLDKELMVSGLCVSAWSFVDVKHCTLLSPPTRVGDWVKTVIGTEGELTAIGKTSGIVSYDDNEWLFDLTEIIKAEKP